MSWLGRDWVVGTVGVVVVGVTAAVGWSLASGTTGGEADADGDASGGDVVLEPAASMSADAFFEDLDLYPDGERALTEPVGASTFDAFGEPDERVALAGRTVRPFEPGTYSGTHDRPPCDVEALATLLDDQAEAAGIAAWFAVLEPAEDEQVDYVDDLTPVRLRFDTRVTSHRFEDGEAIAFQALLQAGTGVLVDESGTPRVRCAGGSPLDDPEPAPDLDGDAAFELDELAANPDEAWEGLDPAQVVVVTGSAPQEHFDIADPADGSLFRRPMGSDGSRDQTLEDRPDPCAEGCRALTIAVELVDGTPVNMHYEPTGGTSPADTTETELAWGSGQASPGTYRFSVDRDYELYMVIEDADDFDNPLVYDNPAYDDEDIVLDVPDVMQCIPGGVVITITVDGAVAQTLEEEVGCVAGGRTFEYTLE